MTKKIENKSSSLLASFQPGTRLVVAVSGGPDSVYLLDELLKVQSKLNLELIIAHVNHGLRGKESDADAVFVKKLAQKNRLRFELKKIKKLGKGNLEELCREERYKFLEKTRQKYKADIIVTAHHVNDNIETVLFNFLRGSSVDGLAGMAIYDPKRYLLRPLLQLTKEEILKSLKKNRTPYRVDSSNKDTSFSRNLLRQKIIPLLKKINPNLEQTLSENMEHFGLLKNYLAAEATEWLNKNRVHGKIDHEAFLKLEPFSQKNVIGKIYKETYGSSKKFNQRHMAEVLKMLLQKKSNKQKEFGDHHEIHISKNNAGRIIEIREKRS